MRQKTAHKQLHTCVLAGNDDDDDSEVESLLQRVSESRHAGDRRDALAQLRDLLYDSQQASAGSGVDGRPLNSLHELFTWQQLSRMIISHR